MKKYFAKITSITVIVCFLFSFVISPALANGMLALQATEQYKQIFTNFVLPYSFGQITSAHYGATDRVLINIQDLHSHPKVQKNISNIIGLFDKKYGVNKVFLEGAYGQISTKWIKEKTNNRNKNKILEMMLDTGRLTGAEYYSAKSDKTEIIAGLEKKEPYLDNLKRFGQLLEEQEKIDLILKTIEDSTKDLKEKYYGKRQKKIEKLSQDYKDNKITSKKYYSLLSKHIDKLGIDISKYENMLAYIMLLELQKGLDYGKITKELQNLIYALKGQLPYNAYKKLLENTDNFTRTDSLYIYVIQIARLYNIDLSVNFSNLDKYFRYIELSQKINPITLVKEEDKLRHEINTRFSETQAQRDVVFLIDFEKYLKDYITTKITSDDYNYYKENIKDYEYIYGKYVDNKVLSFLKPYIKEVDNFYEINNDRNIYFADNLFGDTQTANNNFSESASSSQIINASNIKSQSEISKIIDNMKDVKKIDIVITGGFHSQTVTEILKNHGTSYIVITPNVTDGVKVAEETYHNIVKEQSKISFQTLASLVASLSTIEQIKLLKAAGISEQELVEIYTVSQIEQANQEPIAEKSILEIDSKTIDLSKVLESDETDEVKEGIVRILKDMVSQDLKDDITPELLDKIKAERLKNLLENKQEIDKVIRTLSQDSPLRQAMQLVSDAADMVINRKIEVRQEQQIASPKKITSKSGIRSIIAGVLVAITLFFTPLGSLSVSAASQQSVPAHSQVAVAKQKAEVLNELKLSVSQASEDSEASQETEAIPGISFEYFQSNNTYFGARTIQDYEKSIEFSQRKEVKDAVKAAFEMLGIDKDINVVFMLNTQAGKNSACACRDINTIVIPVEELVVPETKILAIKLSHEATHILNYGDVKSGKLSAIEDEVMATETGIIWDDTFDRNITINTRYYGEKKINHISAMELINFYSILNHQKEITKEFKKLTGNSDVELYYSDVVFGPNGFGIPAYEGLSSTEVGIRLIDLNSGATMLFIVDTGINIDGEYKDKEYDISESVKNFRIVEKSAPETVQENVSVSSALQTVATLDYLRQIGIRKGYANPDEYKNSIAGIFLGVVHETFGLWKLFSIGNIKSFIDEHDNPTTGQKIAVWVIRALSLGVGIGTGAALAVTFSPLLALVGLPALIAMEWYSHFIYNAIKTVLPLSMKNKMNNLRGRTVRIAGTSSTDARRLKLLGQTGELDFNESGEAVIKGLITRTSKIRNIEIDGNRVELKTISGTTYWLDLVPTSGVQQQRPQQQQQQPIRQNISQRQQQARQYINQMNMEFGLNGQIPEDSFYPVISGVTMKNISLPIGDISESRYGNLIRRNFGTSESMMQLYGDFTEATRQGQRQRGKYVDLQGYRGEIIVVGDIHGQLPKLLQKIEANRQKLETGEAIIVFEGDYIHREASNYVNHIQGSTKEEIFEKMNSSIATIQFLMQLKIAYPQNVYMLAGNHDIGTSFRKGNSVQGREFYGALDMYYGSGSGVNFENAMRQNLALVAETNRYIIAHAGPAKGANVLNWRQALMSKTRINNETDFQQPEAQLLWGRYGANNQQGYNDADVTNFAGNKILIVGHTHTKDKNFYQGIISGKHIAIIDSETTNGYGVINSQQPLSEQQIRLQQSNQQIRFQEEQQKIQEQQRIQRQQEQIRRQEQQRLREEKKKQEREQQEFSNKLKPFEGKTIRLNFTSNRSFSGVIGSNSRIYLEKNKLKIRLLLPDGNSYESITTNNIKNMVVRGTVLRVETASGSLYEFELIPEHDVEAQNRKMDEHIQNILKKLQPLRWAEVKPVSGKAVNFNGTEAYFLCDEYGDVVLTSQDEQDYLRLGIVKNIVIDGKRIKIEPILGEPYELELLSDKDISLQSKQKEVYNLKDYDVSNVQRLLKTKYGIESVDEDTLSMVLQTVAIQGQSPEVWVEDVAGKYIEQEQELKRQKEQKKQEEEERKEQERIKTEQERFREMRGSFISNYIDKAATQGIEDEGVFVEEDAVNFILDDKLTMSVNTNGEMFLTLSTEQGLQTIPLTREYMDSKQYKQELTSYQRDRIGYIISGISIMVMRNDNTDSRKESDAEIRELFKKIEMLGNIRDLDIERKLELAEQLLLRIRYLSDEEFKDEILEWVEKNLMTFDEMKAHSDNFYISYPEKKSEFDMDLQIYLNDIEWILKIIAEKIPDMEVYQLDNDIRFQLYNKFAVTKANIESVYAWRQKNETKLDDFMAEQGFRQKVNNGQYRKQKIETPTEEEVRQIASESDSYKDFVANLKSKYGIKAFGLSRTSQTGFNAKDKDDDFYCDFGKYDTLFDIWAQVEDEKSLMSENRPAKKQTANRSIKLHVSANSQNAQEIYGLVRPILDKYNLKFKTARTFKFLDELNNGQYGASQIGKFMTIYLPLKVSYQCLIDAAMEIDAVLSDYKLRTAQTSPKIFGEVSLGSSDMLSFRDEEEQRGFPIKSDEERAFEKMFKEQKEYLMRIWKQTQDAEKDSEEALVQDVQSLEELINFMNGQKLIILDSSNRQSNKSVAKEIETGKIKEIKFNENKGFNFGSIRTGEVKNIKIEDGNIRIETARSYFVFKYPLEESSTEDSKAGTSNEDIVGTAANNMANSLNPSIPAAQETAVNLATGMNSQTKELNRNLDGNLSTKLVVARDGDEARQLSMQGINSVFVKESFSNEFGGLKIAENYKGTGKDVRVKISDEGEIKFCIKTDMDLTPEMIDELLRKLDEEIGNGRKIKGFEEIGQIVRVTDDGILNNIKNNHTNSITLPGKELKFDLTKRQDIRKGKLTNICIKEAESTEAKTFIINALQAEELRQEIESLQHQGYRFITNYENSKDISEILFDGSKVNATDVKTVDEALKLLNGLKNMKLAKGINMQISVRLSNDIYSKLNIDIFDQYGIIPIVDMSISDKVSGKKEIEDAMDEKNFERILRDDNVVSIIVDEDSKEYISKNKDRIKQAKSTKAKYNKGAKAARSSKFDYTTTNITALKDIFGMDVLKIDKAKLLAAIKENYGVLSADTQTYLEYLQQKGEYEEMLGFVRGVVLNSVAEQITKLENITIDKEKFMEDKFSNTVEAILIMTVQQLIAGRTLEEMFVRTGGSDVLTAEEYLDDIKTKLNGVLDAVLRNNETKIDTENAVAAQDFDGIPELLMDSYKPIGSVGKDINISMMAVKSMLSAA